ncbi:MAG: hypothetical protein UX81_C0007G0013 [Parcubacteria group bacterium GW2011_GWA2_47_12]|uniref:Uncharacterized protein n=1 Tax=Candidatus Giovannonibacteria bacterium RIFCSPLOWO2_01_FULL_44_16 TaxID=1798348 RepID=A0A1F5X0F3_9BACT|nr:MAG: hypothetical protein UX81_C0007G0013 [Parcubacteria group bacterium GW2011_GWA2_47_12]OGF81388.1 MAG: hypothetical protein A2924_03240 [Candidatus Giovannonibacteria bacterium RIFCSPLOWO2_01_FULL_44_16]
MDSLNGSLDVNELRTGVNDGKEEARRLLRFTKRAHRRVLDSFYSKALNEHFEGQLDVDLLEVEKAIIEFENKDSDSGKKNIEHDPDAEEIITCDLHIANVCAGEIMPRQWDWVDEPVKKNDDDKKPKPYKPGNYCPDLLDEEGKDYEILAVCVPCYRHVREFTRRENDALKKEGKETKLIPRSLSLSSAQDAFDRRAYAIKMQTQGKEITRERVQRRADETLEDTRKLANRFTSFKPELKRGESKKHGRGNGNNGRDRDSGYHG